MTNRRWSDVSYLDALRPDPEWQTEFALLASYSADLVALVAALLALAGRDDDRGSGSRVDFAHAVDQLSERVRLVSQAGRLKTPRNEKILAILDRYIREVNVNEQQTSWHPKIALVKQIGENEGQEQWRLWIGSRNLTSDLSWDVGLTLVGGRGTTGDRIDGIPELGASLAERADLERVEPKKVLAQLRQVRWQSPPGTTVRNLRLVLDQSPRGLPEPPDRLQELIVVSPFLDGNTVSRLGRWGNEKTRRTLISTLPALRELAQQKQRPLAPFQTLLYLDAPALEVDAASEAAERENSQSQDEEPEPRGLHAKLISARCTGQHLLWTGSANATHRGWDGPNAEVIAELAVSSDVAAGLMQFVETAQVVNPAELEVVILEDEIAERLEAARKQVAGAWQLKQVISEAGCDLQSPTDPNVPDAEMRLEMGNINGPLVIWPRNATTLRLPFVAAADVSELVCCRLSLGDDSVTWLQRAPLDPHPGEDRDHQALARYLSPRTFLQWVRSLLTGEPAGDGGGDWDGNDPKPPQTKGKRGGPSWWAPTIEEVLRAWSHEPKQLVEIDRKVGHYLKIYDSQPASDQPVDEKRVVDEFRESWQILRRQLVPGVR